MHHPLHAWLRRSLITALLTAPVIAAWAAGPGPAAQPQPSSDAASSEAGDALAPTLPYGAGYERRRRAGRTSPELPWPPSANDSPTPADDTTATTGVGNARGQGGNSNSSGNGNGSNGNGRGGRGGRR